MERFIKRLNKEDSVLSVNQNLETKVPLVNTTRLFLPNDINHVVNQFEQFQKERNESTKFRLLGTIKTLFANPLFNNSDDADVWGGLEDNNWSSFYGSAFINRGFMGNIMEYTYKEAYTKFLSERNGWFGFVIPFTLTGGVSTCEYHDMLPSPETFKLNSPTHHNNWGFKITYPFTSTTEHHLVEDGLLLGSHTEVVIGGRNMSEFRSITKHGLKIGDHVRVSGLSPTPTINTYRVKQLGKKNGSDVNYNFIIDTSREPITSMVTGRMKKVMNYGGISERESNYYIRQFKPITENNDYELYPLVLAQNIYEDQTNQIVFNGGIGNAIDLDVGGLRDNLNRPISQLYLTTVKNNNLGFTNIQSGFDFPYCCCLDDGLNDVSDTHRLHNVTSWPVTSHTPLNSNVTINDDLYFGDIVEYNVLSQKETILSEVSHTFTTNNRVTNGRPEGYMYKPHHLYEIRKFSPYVEQGNTATTYNIPSYACEVGEGRMLWRDYMWLGFGKDKLDYPYTNDAHYIHQNLLMVLKRQDPLNKYGLYYTSDDTEIEPRDPFGDIVDDNNFVIHQSNVC